MVIWWLCWHRTILIRNITQKPYSQFPPVHDFGKPWWGVAYVPCMTNLRALCAWVIRWHVTCMLSLAEHWQGRRALSNHVCAHSVISMWHVVCLQHLARACSEQSRSTTVLPINHVIQMPQCLSGFVNHYYYVIIRPFCHIIVVCFLWTWHSGSKLGWYRPDAGSHRADASVFLTHNAIHIQSGEGAYRQGNSLDDSRLWSAAVEPDGRACAEWTINPTVPVCIVDQTGVQC